MKRNSMVKRTLIRKIDLFEFRGWLLTLGWKEEPPRLEHEVLRMKSDGGIAVHGPLLVYGNLNDDHLITFGISRDLFKNFQKAKKEGRVIRQEKPASSSFGLASFVSQKPIQFNDTKTRLATTSKIPHGVPDLVGKRFGRFLVIGWAKDFKASWVVMCACGIYTTRRTKAVTNPTNNEDRCERCRRFASAAKKMEHDSQAHNL